MSARTTYLREDGRYGLRRYRASDVQGFLEAARESTREVYPWLPWCRPDFALEDAERWVRSREQAWADESECSLVLSDLATEAFVAGIGVNRIDRAHLVGNLGYWVRTAWSGRGAATAAVRMACDFALRDLGLERIEIVVIEENVGSQRVAEKAGARREGLLRKKLRAHGESHDSIMYSLVRADFDS